MDGNLGKPDGAAVETIFHAALEIPLPEREAYLDSACGDDAQLHQRVSALLRAFDAPEGFLPEASSGKSVLEALPPPVPGLGASEKPGDRIGRYKLLQNIGEGGCGVVYMAEQEEPVRRRVALKVIKLGMDTKQVVARFEAERQALALMEHMNIAKVLDAGATDTGRPFFVMELVRGMKITEYCDQNRLSTRERLDLFVQVCRAIEHAHQKGIIHRDIKPSNVLVTMHDGVPVPKVIDFGIAKATQGRLTDRTLFTAFEQFIGTPAYMSPEQAEMSGLDIDTRSDIYSLGVLLYELLTGKTPFDAKELLASGLDRMRQTIRQTEPTRPSTMLSTMFAADLATAARQRRTEAPKLISAIRGDLEWIVMKCLEKDRTRRYEAAGGLAADIERYVNDEPVLARPPSTVYLFRKFVGRHRLLFASSSAIAAALLVGLGLSTWLWMREREASRVAKLAESKAELLGRAAETAQLQAEVKESQARSEARKSQQVARFLTEMLNGIGPSVAMGRDTAVLREILSNAVDRVSRDLSGQPEVEAELLSTMGSVYLDLGDFAKAETLLARVLAIRQPLYPTNSLSLAQAYSNLGVALRASGKGTQAVEAQRRGVLMFEELLGKDDLQVAAALHLLGQSLAGQGKASEAEAVFRRALSIRQDHLVGDHLEVAQSLADVAAVLSSQGRWEEAERLYYQALAIEQRLLRDGHPSIANLLDSLAKLLLSHNKNSEAEQVARQALEIRTRLLGKDHPLVAETRVTLANVLWAEDKLSQAETQTRAALDSQREHLATEHPGLADTLNLLVDLLLPQHREADLDELFNDLEAQLKALGKQNSELINARANFFARTRRWEQAAVDFEKMIQLRPQDHENYHFLAALRVQLGDLAGYRRVCGLIRARFGETTNDPVIADRMAKDCCILPLPDQDRAIECRLATIAVTLGQGRPVEAWFQLSKGLAEYRQGNFASAIQWMQKVLSKEEQNANRAVEAYMIVAMAQEHLNQPDAAYIAYAKGVEISQKNPPDFATSSHSWVDWIFARSLTQEAQNLILSSKAADHSLQ